MTSCSRRASELVDQLTDEELATRLDAALIVGWSEVHSDRFDDAATHFERGLDVIRATGQGQLLVPMKVGLVAVFCLQGRLREAGHLVELAVESGRLSGLAQLLAWPLQEQCWVATDRGDLDAAVRYGEESVRLARQLGQQWITALAGCTLATTWLEVGDAERCRRELLDAAGGPDLPLLGIQQRCWSYEVLTRAEIARGCLADADRWATRAEGAAVPTRPRAIASAWLARAAVLLANGAPSAAAELALGAAATAEGVGAHIVAGRSRTLAGRALAEAQQRGDAIVHLERAEADLLARGAVRLSDEAARELRRLGRRVARRGRGDGTGTLGLSRREARGRPARDRGQDQPRDRRRAVPEREDRREPPVERLRQARRGDARRRRRCPRARAAGLIGGRPHEHPPHPSVSRRPSVCRGEAPQQTLR